MPCPSQNMRLNVLNLMSRVFGFIPSALIAIRILIGIRDLYTQWVKLR
jgi:hypothetical protein